MLLTHDWTIDNWPPMLTLVVWASIIALVPMAIAIICLLVDGLRAPPQSVTTTGARRRLSSSPFAPDRQRTHRGLGPRSAASLEERAVTHWNAGRLAPRRGGAL
jgi:hypothetical protein